MINYLNNQQFNIDSLTLFIKENISEIYDFFKFQNHLKLKEQEKNVVSFLLDNNQTIKALDYSLLENTIFLDILIDVCEQLYLPIFFQNFLNLKAKNKLTISSRQLASQLYIKKIKKFGDFESILNDFLEKLEYAYLNEEDDNKRVNYVFFNMYSRILRDFKGIPDKVQILVDKIKIESDKYTFFNSEIKHKILSIDITDVEIYSVIQEILNNFLERRVIETFCISQYLIENNTEYFRLLSSTERDIYSIRKLSVSLYNGDNAVYNSLGRGVSILQECQQLYGYMNSFGKMHFKKCITAFENLPHDFFSMKIDINDWGAGQGLASMTYLDFINKNNYNQKINQITLNEPSEIALKRGSLHLKKYNDKNIIRTVNKKLDDLTKNDFTDFAENAKLHLFSNILDIDDYSSYKLTNLISTTFKGENYFVIISPYITDTKNNRIQLFVDFFKKYSTFTSIYSFEKIKNEWITCETWSIFLRIFKVNL